MTLLSLVQAISIFLSVISISKLATESTKATPKKMNTDNIESKGIAEKVWLSKRFSCARQSVYTFLVIPEDRIFINL